MKTIANVLNIKFNFFYSYSEKNSIIMHLLRVVPYQTLCFLTFQNLSESGNKKDE